MIKTSVSLAQREHYQQVLNTLGIARWAKRDAVVAPLQDLAFADDLANVNTNAGANTNADMAQEVAQMTDAVTHTEKQPAKQETKQEIKEPQITKQNTEKTSHTNDHADSTPAKQSEAEPCPAFSLYAVAYKNWLLLADDSMMLSDNSSALQLWQSLTAALAKEARQTSLPVQQFDFPLLDEPNTHTFSSASAAATGWLYSMTKQTTKQMQPAEQGSGQYKIYVGLLAEIDDRLLTNSSEVIDMTQFPQPLEFTQLPTLAHMLADWQLKKVLWKKINEQG